MERPRDVPLEGFGKRGQTKAALVVFGENAETGDGP
jgi:hypothetical protein